MSFLMKFKFLKMIAQSHTLLQLNFLQIYKVRIIDLSLGVITG